MGQKSCKGSKHGLDMAKQRKEEMKLSQQELAEKANNISTSTVKRFFRGEAITLENFQCICKVLGLDWQDIVANDENIHIEDPVNTEDAGEGQQSNSEKSTTKRSITIVGIFTKDQQLKLGPILEALKDLLKDAKIYYGDETDINN